MAKYTVFYNEIIKVKIVLIRWSFITSLFLIVTEFIDIATDKPYRLLLKAL